MRQAPPRRRRYQQCPYRRTGRRIGGGSPRRAGRRTLPGASGRFPPEGMTCDLQMLTWKAFRWGENKKERTHARSRAHRSSAQAEATRSGLRGPTIYQASLRSASRLYASGAAPMQSFMAVPVDAITCTHGLSHRAQGLARNGCVVSDEAATQERCGAYLGRCSP